MTPNPLATTPEDETWPWPVRLAAYDQSWDLSPAEDVALGAMVAAKGGAIVLFWKQDSNRATLHRLTHPIADVAQHFGARHNDFVRARSYLLQASYHRRRTYWGWSEQEWLDTLNSLPREATGPVSATRRTAPKGHAGSSRQIMLAVAYLLTGFNAAATLPAWSFSHSRLAAHIFGQHAIDTALARICTALHGLRYHGSDAFLRTRLRFAMNHALLASRSPYLEDLSLGTLDTLRVTTKVKTVAWGVVAISHGLHALGLVDTVLLDRREGRIPLPDRLQDDGVAPTWVAWCKAWHQRCTLSARTKDHTLYLLIYIGRWLATTHPDVTSPEQWDMDLAAEYVAAVDALCVGDWWSATSPHATHKRPIGKPVAAATKVQYLGAMRRFFRDLQDIPHRIGDGKPRTIPRRFNPMQVLRTPRSVLALLGPDPRVIDDAWWLKILAAAEQLTEADLPRLNNAYCFYPVEMVRALAVTWCYSGRRRDEIRRLEVGCIRWQWTDGMISETGEPVPDDAVCYLDVPVSKTASAFTVPVHALIGKRIAEWEAVRPPQRRQVDRKSSRPVDYLFSYRGRQIGPSYINDRLIPLLCQRAGVPIADRRGPITSHRARATIASAYYNVPAGLNASEVQEWLGHRSFRSTRSYLKVNPRRLAQSVERASEGMRTVRGKMDPDALTRGEPGVFYALGNGTYCANPAWASCPHRLACLQCPMFVDIGAARTIDARDSIVDFTQQISMTPEEKAAADGDIVTLTSLIEHKKHVPPPAPPHPGYIFNHQAQVSQTGKPLTVLPLLPSMGLLQEIATIGQRLVRLQQALEEAEAQRHGAVVKGIRSELATTVHQLAAAQQRLAGREGMPSPQANVPESRTSC